MANLLGVDEDDETFIRSDEMYFVIDVSVGDKLCLYASECENDEYDYMTLNSSADCFVYGNVMSLLTHSTKGA
ncbi:MAG: hypothetical protein K6C98_10745 [Treponema sp.]|nr:hypothetical protein [Treponema sp.]